MYPVGYGFSMPEDVEDVVRKGAQPDRLPRVHIETEGLIANVRIKSDSEPGRGLSDLLRGYPEAVELVTRAFVHSLLENLLKLAGSGEEDVNAAAEAII